MSMKITLTCALVLIAAGAFTGCSGSSPAAGSAPPPAAAITGVDTPPSVSVVTAN